MVSTTAHDPSTAESLRTLFNDNAADSGVMPDKLVRLGGLSRPLSADDYIKEVKIAFEAFADALPPDFIPAILPPDYLQTCNVDFKPTAARILQHDLANAMNAVLAYNPDIAFRENERDMSKPNGIQENALMAEMLVDSFQQFGQSFHMMRESATLRPDAAILLDHFDLFNAEMITLTQRMSNGHDTLHQLADTLRPPVADDDKPSLHTTIKNQMMRMN